jgi:hypothetical protein
VHAIPYLGRALSCCFCLPTLAGAALAVAMYLKERPNERMSASDGAICGGIVGVISGVLAAILGWIVALVFGAMNMAFLGSVMRNVPNFMSGLAFGGMGLFFAIPFNGVVYGGMGALGGFLALQLFYKNRLAQ